MNDGCGKRVPVSRSHRISLKIDKITVHFSFFIVMTAYSGYLCFHKTNNTVGDREQITMENYNGEDTLHSKRRGSESSMALEEEEMLLMGALEF